MKKIIAAALSLCLFAACTKDSGNTNKPPVNNDTSLVTSVWVRDTIVQQTFIDSFTYDSNKRLSSLKQFHYQNYPPPSRVSIREYLFSYNGNDLLPVSAVIENERHLFAYNGSGQIIKDSVTNAYTFYYGYGKDVLYIKQVVLSPAIGTYIDTIRLQNGSMSSGDSWAFPQWGVSHSTYAITQSAYANPLHNFKGIGLLMNGLTGGLLDYFSTNLYSTYTVNGVLINTNSWIANNGRVDAGVRTLFLSDTQKDLLINFYYK